MRRGEPKTAHNMKINKGKESRYDKENCCLALSNLYEAELNGGFV